MSRIAASPYLAVAKPGDADRIRIGLLIAAYLQHVPDQFENDGAT
jgi:hypothetical protein